MVLSVLGRRDNNRQRGRPLRSMDEEDRTQGGKQVKTLVYIWIIGLLGVSLVAVIWPAEDTYINPVEVRPVETRVERVVSDPVNLSQQIEVNVKEVASLETRVTEIERNSARIDVVERQAMNAFANADATRTKLDKQQEQERQESDRRLIADLVLFGFIIGGVISLALALRHTRKSCRRAQRTSEDTPTKRL